MQSNCTDARWLLHGWRVSDMTRVYFYFRSWDLHVLSREDAVRPRLVDTPNAENALRMSARDPSSWGRRIIEKMYRALTRRDDLPSMAPQALEEHLLTTVLRAVRARELVAVAIEPSTPPQRVTEAEPPPEPREEEPPPATFDLQVVLDDDGSAVEQLSVTIKDPGRTDFGALRTDNDGSIHIQHTVRGTADLRMEIKGARLDQSAVVVGWGTDRVRESTAKSPDEAPAIRYLVEVEDYRVRDGDDADTLAARARMSWRDLAYFNWGTRDAEEIEARLGSEVGCAKRTPDGGYAFSEEDWPGIIRIPRPFEKSGLPTGEQNIARVVPVASRVAPLPVACWRLGDPAFAFESSFVEPAFRNELRKLGGVVAANPGTLAALFAHTDPVGDDGLNKTLSDRRAIAVYGLLTHQPELWSKLYDSPFHGDRWGTKALQRILASLSGEGDEPYYTTTIDGDYGPMTARAVRRFQADVSLAVDGDAGPKTRAALFDAYMDWLCTPRGTDTPLRLEPSRFVGGAQARPGALPRGALQGCGRFNPVVLLPKSEMGHDNKEARDADDAANRRVLLFFFAKTPAVELGGWPCPAVQQGHGACLRALWSDGDERRQNTEEQRRYQDTGDTMACRFYDRFASKSPCEGRVEELLDVWLLDELRRAMPVGTRYRIEAAGRVYEGVLDQPGLVQIPAKVPAGSTIQVQWADFVPPTLVGLKRSEVSTPASKAHSVLAFSVDSDEPPKAPVAPSPPTSRPLTRSSIYVPVSVGDMSIEAAMPIDPAKIEPIEPSWQTDGSDLFDEDADGHFLARQLLALEVELYPDALPDRFDTRLYFTHPLAVHHFPIPKFPKSEASQSYFYRADPIVVANGMTDATEAMLNNLRCESLDDFKQLRCIENDDEAKRVLADFHANPSNGKPPSKQDRKAPKSAVTAPKPPWYSAKPGGPGTSISLLGATPTLIEHLPTRRFFLAANKRMVKQWMGELKYYADKDPVALAYLDLWFGTREGERHFASWAQKLGVQFGKKDTRGPHFEGKANDFNYEYNGWCPLFNCDEDPRKPSKIVGEERGISTSYVPTGMIYDRALRVFVPVRATPDDPHGVASFARRFYRNHWDWQLPTFGATAPSGDSHLPIDLVYRYHQILNWAFVFYFHYGYGRLRIEKEDYKPPLGSINSVYSHRDPLPPDEIWQNIAADIRLGRLPSTSEFFCEEKKIPEAARRHFESVDVTYPYAQDTKPLMRLPLNQPKELEVALAGNEGAVGEAIRKQLIADHDMAAHALQYTAPSLRDPCRGVFNHSFEFILATGGLLKDPGRVICFGGFTDGNGGDIQHFEYDFRPRFKVTPHKLP